MRDGPAPPLDAIEGFRAEGDVVGVTMSMLDGRRPLLVNALEWPVPDELLDYVEIDLRSVPSGADRIGITDELIPITPGVAFLRPPSLVVGLSTPLSADAEAFEDALTDALAQAGLSRSSVACIALAEEHAGIELPHLALAPTFVTDEQLLDLTAHAAHPGQQQGRRAESELLALSGASLPANIVAADRRYGTINVAIARLRRQ